MMMDSTINNIHYLFYQKVPWKSGEIPPECQLISSNCDDYNWNNEMDCYSINTTGAFLSQSLYSYHIRHWYSLFDR